MPLRAKLHFYPTPQKPFIYAVYFPYFRTYFSEYSENSPFQGHFYVLPFFSSSLIEFHLLCNDIFSFLFSILIQFPFAVNTPYSFLQSILPFPFIPNPFLTHPILFLHLPTRNQKKKNASFYSKEYPEDVPLSTFLFPFSTISMLHPWKPHLFVIRFSIIRRNEVIKNLITKKATEI